MDDGEFRENLIARDRESLDDRIKRWKQIQPASYGVYLPDLLWEYIVEADDMYIRGHHIGVILLCSATLELVLKDQLIIRKVDSVVTGKTPTFEKMIDQCNKSSILSNPETSQVHSLRELRNALVHGNAGKIHQMAREYYPVEQVQIDPVVTQLYLASFGGEGISEDARKYLKLARDITIKFYGQKE
jgi:hypothetical protein